jgi:hypothetical protein
LLFCRNWVAMLALLKSFALHYEMNAGSGQEGEKAPFALDIWQVRR